MELSGKVALVTGASRGIGRAIAVKLARLGATLAIHHAGSPDKASEVVSEIERAGARAFAVQADLSHAVGSDVLADAVERGLGEFGFTAGVHILVNNAGVSRRGPFNNITIAEFDHTIDLNLRAPFLLIQRIVERMGEGGRIVNISSMVTRAAYPELAAYTAAKGGLEALTLALAPVLGARGITINAVRPGATLTDMNAGLHDPASARRVAQTVALGRIGMPEDVAEVVAFLATDHARWITGACIEASGGQRL